MPRPDRTPRWTGRGTACLCLSCGTTRQSRHTLLTLAGPDLPRIRVSQGMDVSENSLCGKIWLCYNPDRASLETRPAQAAFGEREGDSVERVQHIVYRSNE